MSATDTYSLAHTARCKLQIAADRPDRNLRFILGHAFTLDKLRLRIAEIEIDGDDSADETPINDLSQPLDAPHKRRVSFSNHSQGRSFNNGSRKPSPPPVKVATEEVFDDDDGDADDDRVEDDEEADGLGLQRFDSGSARRSRMVPDEGDDDDDDDELISPPLSPTEEELRVITSGASDDGLAETYDDIANCHCHEQAAPKAVKAWDIPQKPGQYHRYAVIVVNA